MFKATRTRIIGLALIGVVALGGAIYATTALTGGEAAAAPATQTASDPQLRAGILDMLEDHMGLTGPEAEQFADRMIARMQNFDPDFDLQEMIDRCAGYATDGTQGRGSGMMGGYGAQGCGVGDYGTQSQNGTQGGGMMGGYGTQGRGMMGR